MTSLLGIDDWVVDSARAVARASARRAPVHCCCLEVPPCVASTNFWTRKPSVRPCPRLFSLTISSLRTVSSFPLFICHSFYSMSCQSRYYTTILRTKVVKYLQSVNVSIVSSVRAQLSRNRFTSTLSTLAHVNRPLSLSVFN